MDASSTTSSVHTTSSDAASSDDDYVFSNPEHEGVFETSPSDKPAKPNGKKAQAPRNAAEELKLAAIQGPLRMQSETILPVKEQKTMSGPQPSVPINVPSRESMLKKLSLKDDIYDRSLYKSSSTSSIYADSTITSPSHSELIQSTADYFCGLILPISECKLENERGFEIFDESLYRLTKTKVDKTRPPKPIVVQKHVKDIYRVGKLAPEALVMAAAYVRRIVNETNFRMFPHTWRRMTLAALILASKVWEDQAVWNVDFIDIFPMATAKDLTTMERKMLGLLDFDVTLKRSEYSTMYFDLRSQAPNIEAQFKELKLLDKEAANRLEIRSSGFAEKHGLASTKLATKVGSVDMSLNRKYSKPRSRLVLN